MGDEFYAIIKLYLVKKYYHLVSVDENDGDPLSCNAESNHNETSYILSMECMLKLNHGWN